MFFFGISKDPQVSKINVFVVVIVVVLIYGFPQVPRSQSLLCFVVMC